MNVYERSEYGGMVPCERSEHCASEASTSERSEHCTSKHNVNEYNYKYSYLSIVILLMMMMMTILLLLLLLLYEYMCESFNSLHYCTRISYSYHSLIRLHFCISSS